MHPHGDLAARRLISFASLRPTDDDSCCCLFCLPGGIVGSRERVSRGYKDGEWEMMSIVGKVVTRLLASRCVFDIE